jgi:hypothetical protein
MASMTVLRDGDGPKCREDLTRLTVILKLNIGAIQVCAAELRNPEWASQVGTALNSKYVTWQLPVHSQYKRAG